VFGQFRWEQAFGIFDINFAVNYGTTGSLTPKISQQPCTAERRTTPMTSFLYDVIHVNPFAVLNVPILDHCCRVWGNL